MNRLEATALPRRKAGVSAGAVQKPSSSSSSQVSDSEQPAMSRLVTSSPTSGATISTPASTSRAATSPYRAYSSSYLVAPRPLTTTAARREPAGRSASTFSTRVEARLSAFIQPTELIPGSPWMPSPKSILPRSTWNSGSSAPGSVQPWKATPNEYVAAFAAAITRSTSSRSAPASAAAPAIL